ncbi:ABC transporter ATP-binding protein [Planctomycetales bacterium]|nr:ABC transporter ATP-binding protein [Planctomycetales bacterium]GHT38163.1 ABC transporter ATP-binding protein [Planctomycetales bacterium]
MSVIDFNNITKKFGKTVALDDVSFTVEAGTVFALLGENGAGKTTSIKTLLGLVKPDSGASSVLGLDCLKDGLKIRQRTGYVPEVPVLYDWMTAAETGRFAASFYPAGYLAEYNRLLAGYQIDPAVKVKALSKGQRAKVSLALALAHNPELLILDEPTSGLDALVRQEFLTSMIDRAASGKTVFLSSHQIAEVERVADTVAVLKKSKLLLLENLEALKQRTKLLTLTFQEPKASTPGLFGNIIKERVSGRDVSILGQNLSEDAQELLRNNSNISKYELRSASLEEIFIGLMEE